MNDVMIRVVKKDGRPIPLMHVSLYGVTPPPFPETLTDKDGYAYFSDVGERSGVMINGVSMGMHEFDDREALVVYWP